MCTVRESQQVNNETWTDKGVTLSEANWWREEEQEELKVDKNDKKYYFYFTYPASKSSLDSCFSLHEA